MLAFVVKGRRIVPEASKAVKWVSAATENKTLRICEGRDLRWT
jgi:hypothetical protein